MPWVQFMGSRPPDRRCKAEMEGYPEGMNFDELDRCTTRTPKGEWLCSRRHGHEGVHVATDRTAVLARWTDDP